MKPPPLSDSSPFLLTGDPLAPSGYYEIIDDGSEAGRMIPADLEEIFLEQRTVNPRQEVLSTVRRGELTPEVHERAANPAKYLDEPYLYHSQLMTDADADGNEVTTYRILRQRNPSPAVKLLTPPGPPRVDQALWPQVESLRPEDELLLMVKLAGLPDPVVPLPLPPERFDAQAVTTNSERIQAAKLAHTTLVEKKLATLAPDFERWGARVLETFEGIAWVKLSIPFSQVDLLLSHAGFTAIEPTMRQTSDACTEGSDLNPQSLWLLGEGRQAERLDIDRFHAMGYTGHRANSTRHGYSRLLAGVVESSWLEDESPAFSGRFIFKKDCSVSPCVYPTNNNYPDDALVAIGGIDYWVERYQFTGERGSSGSHGTMVSSILTARYTNNEAFGLYLGDPTWDATEMGEHCEDWENGATGMAPGAYLWYVNAKPHDDNDPDDFTPYVRAYNTLNAYNIDVLNCSHSLVYADCNIASSNAAEDTLENLYDNGVLVIAAAGNNLDTKPNTECSLNSPGDTPKVLAIAGLDANDETTLTTTGDCNSNYQECLLDEYHLSTGGGNTATGGLDLTIGVNGDPRIRVYSGIALSAPQRVYLSTSSRNQNITPSETWPSGLYYDNPSVDTWPVGWVYAPPPEQTLRATGTSAASPHVSGAAIALKHWQLTRGNTGFNSPGAMQALLLAMGDRWDPDRSPTPFSRRTLGVDEKSGFGRMKLRLLDNYYNNFFTPTAFSYQSYSFNSSSPSISYYVWPTPLPSGTDFLKCVMFEPEDMSQKTYVSDLYLRVRLYNPDPYGYCNSNSTLYSSTNDATYDLRHMVSIEENLPGRCALVSILKPHVTSSGATAHVFCYYAGVKDYESEVVP
ncbi:MAG: hypothetical protein CVU65_09330 [Deltaproteobacteria bacterium HGW-Deltaproteobacteria-22]|jgi:hypothetical protein|nr:MAG: hypothetical protein CVU65_09330 [Deltaproteobacteria bacterium HGW-Deltaproteobacteria-22]